MGVGVGGGGGGSVDSRYLRGDISWLSPINDLKIGTPMDTLPGAWRYTVSAGTGRPVSVYCALFVCWLLNVPAPCDCISGDGSAKTVLSAATLRQKLQIQLSISPSHSILTPDQPVRALTL